MTDGKTAVTTTQVGYKHIKLGTVKYYDVDSPRYLNERIWEKKTWKCIGMKHHVTDAGRLPSITAQFDPSIAIGSISSAEKNLPRFCVLLDKAMTMEHSDISIRKYILDAPRILVIAVRNLSDANWNRIDRFKQYHKNLSKKNVPVVLLTNVSQAQINAFRKKHQWDIATFQTDDTELKVMSRSYPVFFFIRKGVIKEKYHYFNLPEWKRSLEMF